MAALDRSELFEACRVIYKMAADNYMLPPLIREARSPEAKSSYTYYSLTEGKCVRFVVEFDKAYVDENKLPLGRLPLRFRCELCDLDFRDTPIELDDGERAELIRAFLLGARAPIIVEKNAAATRYRLCIQLSSTFFVECGELVDEGGSLTSEAICLRVGFGLYDKSKEFFGARQDGLMVWVTRAAQELFGDPMPLAEELWPVASAQAETIVALQTREMVHATAAAFGGVTPVAPAPAMGRACMPARIPVIDLAPLSVGAPFIDGSRALAATPSAQLDRALMERRQRYFHSALAAIAIIGAAGLTAGLPLQDAAPIPSAAPALIGEPASALPPAQRAAAMDAGSARLADVVAKQPGPQVALASSAAPQGQTAELRADPARLASVDRPAAQSPAVAAEMSIVTAAGPGVVATVAPPPSAKPGKAPALDKPAALGKGKAGAAKVASLRADGGKAAARGRHSKATAAVLMRRAVNSLAGVVRNIGRIPTRLSSLISGQNPRR